MIIVLCVVATVALYYLNKLLYARYPRLWTHPILLTPIALLALLLATGISLDEYAADTRVLLWFLGPATVAFAVPIYQYRRLIRELWPALAVGTVVGVTAAVASSWWLARAFHLAPEACWCARYPRPSPWPRRTASAATPTWRRCSWSSPGWPAC